jgi:hypothetical protein
VAGKTHACERGRSLDRRDTNGLGSGTGCRCEGEREGGHTGLKGADSSRRQRWEGPRRVTGGQERERG